LEVLVEDVRVTLGGVREHESPAEAEAVRVMVPLKFPRLAIVIVEEPVSPALTTTEVGLALTVKPGGSVMMTLAVWDSDPLVPATVTVRAFVDVELQDKVEV
jgi:hypothetical protein